MASTTTRLAFSFHHHHHHRLFQSSRAGKTSSLLHLPLNNPRAKHPSIPHKYKHSEISRSIDVSKEDKAMPQPPTDAETSGSAAATVEEKKQEEDGEEENLLGPKRGLEEQFAVLNTGIYECRSCGYRYDEAVGDPSYPIPPGFQFEKLPEDWRCPTCGAAKSFFQSKRIEIAGFAQNQQYGLGGNTLTSGQKTLLIYGSLLFTFALFLSGYFLQ